MRRLGPVPALLLTTALLLGGCGDDATPSASDPETGSPSAPGSPSEPATTDPTTDPTRSPPITPGGDPFTLLEMVTGSAGRGVLSPEAVPLGSEAEVETFVAGLSPQLADDVRAAVAASAVPAGQQLYGAVVGLGCDVPPGVLVDRTGTGVEITGRKVVDPMRECFAAVTSVALVAVA